jgi:phosphomannomutase
MITASHNPPCYNGLKVFGPDGASVPHAVCRAIEAAVDAAADDEAAPPAAIRPFDLLPDYLAELDRLVDRDGLGSRPGRLLVDPMHGAGAGLMVRWLAGTGWQVDQIRANPDPEFGGDRPEPIMPHLQPLVDAVRAGGYALGVAHDGDADRIGAVDETGAFVSPQVIFPLVLRDLVERRGWRGRVAKTVSTTALVDRLCARHDLPLVETPVGFQDIATVLLGPDGLMGGEESGGMSVRGHVPQGDGILMGLLLLETLAASDRTLSGLIAELMRDLGPVAYCRQDIRLDRPVDKSRVVAALSAEPPTAIAGLAVRGVDNGDGVKYRFEDGSWLLIRPSGTEPVLRIYAEARDEATVARLCAAGNAAVPRD